MNDKRGEDLQRTELHAWHVERGARMVPFAGYEMPLQYPTGIIREHLATRRRAGLFDVSHMGRFEIGGKHAETFLHQVLTNNARGLEIGEAQYTFLANEGGGAVDDAYLYRLAPERFLLVVNAANRARDRAWLDTHRIPGSALADRSEELCMFALQGPDSNAMAEQVFGRDALPEHKRNRLSRVSFQGREVIVSRTGYTGEPVCFELFAPRERALALWRRLIGLGAFAAGLGARDSLRLEAGLPLYGHELGLDPEGREIPVFANSLARFAVRLSCEERYLGCDALVRQREQYVGLRRGELHGRDADLLPRLVQPIAAFGSRRPLRAGYRVRHEGEAAGYVTSGTTVPYSAFHGEGVGASPAEAHEMRPIGLALLDNHLCYRSDRPVVLEVCDERGRGFEAELVERNLWPAAPYPRPYLGFDAPPPPAVFDAGKAREQARRLRGQARANHRWRRERCINLIPSEQCTSAYVDALCAHDPAGRYNEHKRLRALGAHAPEVRFYKGTAFIMEREEELKAALRAFFGCRQVEARALSGQMANDTVYDAVKQFRNRYRGAGPGTLLGPVVTHDLNRGGHLSAQVPGALKNYVMVDPVTERPAVLHFPIRRDDPHRIDVPAALNLIAGARPDLIVFGRSVILHPEPVREIASFVHQEFGRDDPGRPLLLYDGAHVLGLLGAHFQDPLAEGADLVTGSTHKTFFGPQRGVILGNIEPGSAFEELWRHIEARAFPGHVSNHHLGTLLGLLGATYEMLEFKDEYPPRVIANAKAFARALHREGLLPEGDPAIDFSATHQVLLRGARARGEHLASRLERNNIITNPQALHDDPSFAAASGVRMGVQEMTRYGMAADDFRALAPLFAEIVRAEDAAPSDRWRERVSALRAGFTRMRYCFQ